MPSDKENNTLQDNKEVEMELRSWPCLCTNYLMSDMAWWHLIVLLVCVPPGKSESEQVCTKQNDRWDWFINNFYQIYIDSAKNIICFSAV